MTPKTKQHWSSNESNKQGNETQIWAQFGLRQFYGGLSESILWQETTCTTSPSTSRQSDLTRRRGLGFTSSPLFVIWRFGCGDTPSPGIIGREWLNQVFIARLYFGVSSFVRGLLVQIRLKYFNSKKPFFFVWFGIFCSWGQQQWKGHWCR